LLNDVQQRVAVPVEGVIHIRAQRARLLGEGVDEGPIIIPVIPFGDFDLWSS